jgi:type II secretory pathway pseudopilin PulG
MQGVLRDGRGMALALTLVALVILGALVAGALFSGTADQRMAENARFQQQAFGTAEGVAYGALGTWPANRSTYAGRRDYPLDSAAALLPAASDESPGRRGSHSGTVYRLNRTLYLVDVTARDPTSGARQRVGMLIRIAPPEVDVHAALTVGRDGAEGGGTLNGTDTPPPLWTDCGPTEASVAPVRSAPDTSALYGPGSMEYVVLSGQASVLLSPGSYTPAPVVENGVCATDGQPTNWGDGNDHTGPCGAYLPTVWLKGAGTTSIGGGQGQGVLLVDGDLVVTGAFAFYGLMVVRGAVTASAGGALKVYGAVVAGRADWGSSGRVTVSWSSCAVTDALLAAGAGAMNRSRGWVQLY